MSVLANGGFTHQRAQLEEDQVRRRQNGQGHWGGGFQSLLLANASSVLATM